MSSRDRIKNASYTSPSGDTMAFAYEDVSKQVNRKTTPVQFIGSNVTYVYDDGTEGRQYPMQIFIEGPDNDIEGDKFENLLVDMGVGRLNHPVYGAKNVVPLPFSRQDPLVSGGNETVFTVTFVESIKDIWPGVTKDSGAKLKVASAGLNSLGLNDIANVKISNPADKASFFSKVKALAAGIKNALRNVGDGLDAAQRQIDAIDDAINDAIDLGIAQPLLLARQLQTMMGAPSRILSSVGGRLDGYRNIAKDLFEGNGTGGGGGISSISRVGAERNIVPADGSVEASNTFKLNRGIACFALASMGDVVLGAAPESPEAEAADNTEGNAIDTAEQSRQIIIDLEETVNDFVAWNEGNEGAIKNGSGAPGAELSREESTDIGDVTEGLKEVLTGVKTHLILTTVNLGQVQYYVTEEETHPLQLTWKLYGDMSKLEKLILDNDLNAQEILWVPRGTRIKYYV